MSGKPDWRGGKTLVLWILLCGSCMAVMLRWAAVNSTVIADASVGEQEISSTAINQSTLEYYRLSMETEEGKEGSFRIPLSMTVSAGQISIENHYMDRQLWIYIEGAHAADYQDYVITGDLTPVVAGLAQQLEDTVIIKLQMNTVKEYRIRVEEKNLYLEYADSGDCYDRIVVIDPRYGAEETDTEVDGYSEREITLQIAREVKELLDESDIKAYFTRLEDENVDLRESALLVTEVNADLYVGISFGTDREDPERFGTEVWYNGNYFLPEFGNLQLADLVERRVTEAVTGRANGLIQTDDPVLQQLKIPGVLLKAGYLTHEHERAMLVREDYDKKIAEGILAALQQAFTELHRE